MASSGAVLLLLVAAAAANPAQAGGGAGLLIDRGHDRGRAPAKPLSQEQAAAAVVPRYTAAAPDYEKPLAGLPAVENAEHIVVFTPDLSKTGTYSHGAQIERHGRSFHVAFNNAAFNEDQDGMRVLYTSSADGRRWSDPVDLWPSMPASQFGCTGGKGSPGLFCWDKIHHHALPFVTLNGRLYAVSDLRRHQTGAFFFPVPADDLNATLLRRVLQPARLTAGGCRVGSPNSAACPATDMRWMYAAFGPMFWATNVEPKGMANVTDAFGVRTAADAPNGSAVQLDLALFRDTHQARRYSSESCRSGPCGPRHGEQTVYSVRDSSTDVILYRGKGGDLPAAGWPGDQACANASSCVLLSSSRDTSSPANTWSEVAPTNIPDLGSNLNAGSMADGSVFLVWNGVPRPSVNDTMCSRKSPVRNPLTLAISSNGGTVFDKAWALYNSTRPKRYCGSAKPFGPSYPQAREVTGEGPALDGLWAVYSINKVRQWASACQCMHVEMLRTSSFVPDQRSVPAQEEIGVTFAPAASLKIDDMMSNGTITHVPVELRNAAVQISAKIKTTDETTAAPPAVLPRRLSSTKKTADDLAPKTGRRPLDGAHFLGYNVVNLQSGNFSADPAYAQATAALNSGTLRYPGGNLGDWWDWKKGWCVSNTSVASVPKVRNPCAGGRSGSKPKRRRVYLLEEFKLALDASGALPVIMLNMLTSDVAEQLAFLRHARKIGALPAHSYVELGGEFYWGKFAGRWARGSDYGRMAVEWSQAIKAALPDVCTLAIACHSYEYGLAKPTYRGRAWNKELYLVVGAAGSSVDGVVMHPYLHLGDDAVGGGTLQPLVPPRQKGEGPTGWSRNGTVQRAMASLLSTNEGMEALLGVPFALATIAEGDIATEVALPPSLRLVITEYNVMERAGPFKLSWAHGLFIVAAALNMLSVPAVDAVLLHCLLNGYGWGGLYETTADLEVGGGTPSAGSAETAQGTGQGCLIAGCQGLVTAPYAPTAVGTALGAIAGSMASARTAVRLGEDVRHFPSNPIKKGGVKPNALSGAVAYQSLLAWGFQGMSSSKVGNVTVVNLSERSLPYTPQQAEGELPYTIWSSPSPEGPMAWASERTPVRVRTGTLPKSGTLGLPPYSIVVINGVLAVDL